MQYLEMRACGVLLWAFTALSSATLSAEPVSFVQELVGDPMIPGAVLSWATADQLQVVVAGTRIDGQDAPIDRDDLWHLGAITKSMTATVAARIVEAGLISWETTIGFRLAAIASEIRPEYFDVTLEELLSHVSGLPADLGMNDRVRLSGDADEDVDRANYVRTIFSGEPEGNRDEYLYSNAGYVVVALMLEEATGERWETLMQTHLFEPLGMDSAGFGAPLGDQPQGHRVGLLGLLRPVAHGRRADNIPALGPAGRVHMSAEDVLVYLRAHLLRPDWYLSEATWMQLHSPIPETGYALGWSVTDDGRLRHLGLNALQYAQVLVDPPARRVVFVAVNSGAVDAVVSLVDDVARRMLDMHTSP
jgi:D-alanyl-D-alanine carboxypeptidase